MTLKFLATVSLLGFFISTAQAKSELVCDSQSDPCVVTSSASSDGLIGMIAGIRNTGSTTTGTLVLSAWAYPNGDFSGDGWLIGRAYMDPLPPGHQYPTGSLWFSGLRSDPTFVGTYGVRLVLFELDQSTGSWYFQERTRLDSLIEMTDEGGWSGGDIVVLDPTISVSGNTGTVDIADILNSTFWQTSHDVKLQIIASSTPGRASKSYFILHEENLGTLAPGTSTGSLSRTVGLPLPAGHPYIQVQVVTTDGLPLAYETINNGQPFATNHFATADMDFLVDGDGDGATDQHEIFVGTDRFSAADKPPANVVDVLFLYSTEANTFHNNDIGARIAQLVNASNVYLANSGVEMSLNSVGELEIVGTPTGPGSTEAILYDMRDRATPFQNITALREAHEADFVAFLQPYQNDGLCGIAWLGGYAERGDFQGDSYHRDTAYTSVSNTDCYDHVLLHELGHNMGLGHSRAQGERGTYGWSVGYGRAPDSGDPVDLDGFHSVMAYWSAFNTYWFSGLLSNPDLSCGSLGVPCGISHLDPLDGADSSLSLNVARHQVASYVQRASCDPGQYLQNGQCFDAPAGSYANGLSAYLCDPGYYQDEIGQNACKPAPVDHYVDTSGATGPTPCPAGTIQPLTGQTGCVEDGGPVSPIAAFNMHGDFNGDGTEDILLRNRDDGSWHMTLLTGLAVLDNGGISLPTAIDTKPVVVADFNGDGRDDLLTRDQNTGGWSINLFNGRSVSSSNTAVNSSGAFDFLGSGDLNADGRADIILYDRDQDKYHAYLMNGFAVLETGELPLALQPTSEFRGIVDVNGDGRDDLLFRLSSDGRWWSYVMNGLSVMASGVTLRGSTSAFDLVGFGDLDGDGAGDVILQNGSNKRYGFVMDDGIDFRQRRILRMTTVNSWQPHTMSDFDNDGLTDVLFRNTVSRRWGIYLMNGVGIKRRAFVRLTTNPDWELFGAMDLNGDGATDMLFRNVTNGRWYGYLMNGASISARDFVNTLTSQSYE